MSSRRASGGKMPASPMRSYSSTVKECLTISTDIFLLFLFGPYPALGSGLLDYLLREVSGDGVVVRELHVEGAARRCFDKLKTKDLRLSPKRSLLYTQIIRRFAPFQARTVTADRWHGRLLFR